MQERSKRNTLLAGNYRKALDDDNLRLDCHDLHSETTKEFIFDFW